ncbi:MAG: pantoate--beta-alanine ligase [Bacteroidota bacterium]|nr:pantoate--beta-alanine ligase [Bacteroidota bacterium]
MIQIKRVADIRDYLQASKADKKVIGFVPTMGALHKGHVSLADRSLEVCDITVVSIFVNPKQFNDTEDLKKYPRPLESDLKILEEAGVDVVFIPEVEDIYPDGENFTIKFHPGLLAEMMEGEFRPGHFEGMAEVVYRLLSIVNPDKLFMGQKDFQQLAIVRKMITDLDMPILLEMCPIIREENGLAMSSRNERLSKEARQKAGIIYATLVESERLFEENEPVEEIKKLAMTAFTKEGFEPEYFEIADGVSLQPVDSYGASQYIVALCALRVEGIRLIDNAIWIKKE